jgi:hypothetical protein
LVSGVTKFLNKGKRGDHRVRTKLSIDKERHLCRIDRKISYPPRVSWKRSGSKSQGQSSSNKRCPGFFSGV